MPRILGVNIPDQKRAEIALTYIYGIGRTVSQHILERTKVNPGTRAKDLTTEEMKRITAFISENYRIEGDLRRERQTNIKRLKDIGSWRGMRHLRGLPVRGQQTRTNTRTIRGNVRRTATSGKKRLEKK